jgi:hypothetical protein
MQTIRTKSLRVGCGNDSTLSRLDGLDVYLQGIHIEFIKLRDFCIIFDGWVLMSNQ